MKRLSFVLLLAMICAAAPAQEAGSVQVHDTQLAVLTTQPDNILFKVRIGANEGDILESVGLIFDNGSDLGAIRSLKLYYGGIGAFQTSRPEKVSPSLP